MREAIGGSILFYIILGFLAIYIIFIGIIMNYAATYRASNFVITDIEQTEGEDTQDINALCENLKSRGYNNSLTISCNELDETNDAVYKVITYVKFDVPMLGFSHNYPIVNESKAIYGVGCKYIPAETEITKNCGGEL